MQAATIVDGEILVRQHPDPTPGFGQILVRVRAAGLNGADIAQRAGRYPPAGVPADIPGMEFAGEVAEARAGRAALAFGDRVMSLVGGGAQAELVGGARTRGDAGARRLRLGRRRWPARGVHHRP